tara:strand:+ start:126 stop:374 length:249 start_codon:yes stop_codon:yes gene_type:complete
MRLRVRGSDRASALRRAGAHSTGPGRRHERSRTFGAANGPSSKIVGNFEQGYIAMGYIIIASSVFTIFMRIKGQSSVLCGDQ